VSQLPSHTTRRLTLRDSRAGLHQSRIAQRELERLLERLLERPGCAGWHSEWAAEDCWACGGGTREMYRSWALKMQSARPHWEGSGGWWRRQSVRAAGARDEASRSPL
jgi:hypothetical protein